MTPGAVSHKIKALEDELDQKLFLRQHRGVELTQHGSTLYASVEKAFAEVANALEQIRHPDTECSVTIGATTAVSSLWLGPAISQFWRENGHISVNQLATDSRFSAGNAPELFIRYGRDPRPGLDQHVLYRDTLVPVCAPALVNRLGPLSLEELAQQRLIHLDAEDANWTTWHSWFKAMGYNGKISAGIRVNNYTIALAAAEEDAGVVLGWQRLIRPLLDKKALVALAELSLIAPNRFHLISQPEYQLSSSAIHLRDWLLADLGCFL